MADSKVTALTELTALDGDEQFLVVDDDDGTPVSKRMTVENLAAALAAQPQFTGAWTSYTPSWTTTGTAPAIGNGSITGAWMRLGNTLFVRVYFVAGSSTTFGTGQFQFSLPSGFTSKSTDRQVVSGVLDDISNTRYSMAALVLPSDTKIARLVSNNVSGGASASIPFTWASGDEITMTGVLEGTFA